jgi:alpha-2-macroglobulin
MNIRKFDRLRVVLFVILAVSLACSLPVLGTSTPPPTATPTPRPPAATPTPRADLPPALVETYPLPGSELPLDGPLVLVFNQAMNQSSVEAAFSGSEGLSGRFEWRDDRTVAFAPDSVLPPESELVITIEGSAQAQNGLGLLEPVALRYRTVGYLRLTQGLPVAEAQDVSPTAAIVASFNRPVVPLGVEPEASLSPIRLEPEASGRGEWVNTSTYVFYPEPALAGGRRYTVQVDAALQGLDGAPLEETSAWSFTTAMPEVIGVQPDSEQPVGLEGPFVVTFNQPMDHDSTQASFSLSGPNGPVAGRYDWDEGGTMLTFIPSTPLQRNTSYRLVISRAALTAVGTPLATGLSREFTSAPPLRVDWSNPGENGELSPNWAVEIYLTTAPQTRNLDEFISITPAVDGLSAWWDDFGKVLRVSGYFEAATSYTLELSADLSDTWGGRLGEPYVMRFRTGDYDAALEIDGMYYTQVLFLTAQDEGMPAQAMNLRAVDTSVGSVPLADLFSILAPLRFDGVAGYIPHDGRTFRTQLNQPANQRQTVRLPLQPGGGALAPGVYHVQLASPELSFNQSPFLVAVSNVQMTFKLSASDALVWAVNLNNGQPVSGALVTLYDENGRAFAQGQTDSEGIFRTQFSPQEETYNTRYAVMGEPGEAGFGIALSNWDIGISPWSLGVLPDYRPPRLETYFYTDRPIYRPGQTVYFRLIARQGYNGRYTLPDLGALPVQVLDDLGQTLASYDLRLSEFGTAHGEVTLPDNARPGYYQISLDTPQGYGGVSFQVAEYRKPEIDLSVGFDLENIKAGSGTTARVEARYFFDAPASNVPVSWSLYRIKIPFSIPGYQAGKRDAGWFEPVFYGWDTNYEQLVRNGEDQIGTDGSLRLVFGADELIPQDVAAEPEYTYLYTLEVTLTDEAGLPVSARELFTQHPDDFYIGVRPQSWAMQANEASNFDLLTVDWRRNSAGIRTLTAHLERVTYSEAGKLDAFGFVGYEESYTLIETQTVETNAQGEAQVRFTPPQPGVYRMTVSSGQALTEVYLWAGGPGQASWPGGAQQALRLVADSEQYAPSDVAQVFVPNPFNAPIQALLTVERSEVLRYQFVSLPPGGGTVPVELTAEDAPNVYITVTLINGRDFRYGLLELPVAPVEQTLNVTVTSQPVRAGPGETVTLDLQVMDASGRPVRGEFSLAVVDRAVLALADPNAPDILKAFYSSVAIGVRTGISLAAYTSRELGDMPGGGGGAGEDMVTGVIRQNFEDTAYWVGDLVTGADGRGQVTFTLPDNLTTWQIAVRGLNAATQVGETTLDLVTSKELLVRPVTPRFLVVGDHVQLAAVVQNNTNGTLEAVVTLQTSGLELDDPAATSQMATIPANGRVRLAWWGHVRDVGEVELVFSARAGDLQDAARPAWGALPVLRYDAPQTFGTAGILDEAGERLEVVSLPQGSNPQAGGLQLELSPSLAGAMLSALDVLEHYPYECTEQTLSRFLPNLEFYRALGEFGQSQPDVRARLERTLDTGLARLLAAQKMDGGWSWWGESGQSDPYVTAYVLFGLVRTRDAGVLASSTAIQRAADYLIASQVPVSLATENWQLDRAAFQAFAISQVSEEYQNAIVPYANQLFGLRGQLSPWAQALLALSYTADSEQARTLLSDLQGNALRTATGIHWEATNMGWQNMNTPVFTSAVAVYAIAQRDPASALLPEAVRYLVAHRGANRAWASTYESAWTIMALTQVMRGTGELSGSFSFNARVNGVEVASGDAAGETGGMARLTPVTANVPLANLHDNSPNALVIGREAGTGRLYYSAHLKVQRPVELVEELHRGFSVSRAYYPVSENCPAGDCAPLTGANTGELVQVRLTVTAPQDSYYLVVEDYIPAGAEVLDTRLKTSQQFSGQPTVLLYDERRPFADGWGWWYFNSPQIFDDRITWAADYVPAGTYEFTYILVLGQAGEYRVLPAQAFQYYFPEVQGNSAGAVFTIEE